MCDNIDGAVTFITNLACSAINLAMQGQGAPIYEPSINQMTAEPFF